MKEPDANGSQRRSPRLDDNTTEDTVSIFDKDRPEGYDDKKDGEPKIHPEHLKKADHMKMNAKDIEEFAEHYNEEGEPLRGEQSAP